MVRRFVEYRRLFLLLILVLPLLVTLVLTTPALAAPVVIISPGSGATGTTITIQGNNFLSYKGDYISITFDAFEIPTSPLQVPDSGNFATQFTIPETTTFGRHWITVYSTGGSVSMLARNFFIVEETLITLDVAEGPVGTEVNISGQGFYANRTVNIYYTNISADKIGDTTTSLTGLFSYNFNVPNSIGGDHKITVVNDKGNLAEAQFKIKPEVFTNLAAAGPGELLAMIGTGFGYRSEVEITIGSHPITTVKTNDTGDFEIVFNIPGLNPGVFNIEAVDEYYNQAIIKFTVTATVELSQTSGAVGSAVTISGRGFTVGKSISVLYDDIIVATTTADNLGRFEASFNIPVSNGGNHEITISDGTSTREFIFVVESDAPPAPELKLPVKNTETKSMTYFDWEDADDPSQPVVYRLQVASDQNFSTILRDKSDLSKSEYNLTPDEALPAVPTGLPYYWRVKAIDAAGNESEWSESSYFYIYPPQAPALLYPDLDTTVAIPIFFNWQDITTLNSPVTYHLQISTDLGFSTLVLEEIGLDDSEYYLFEPEYLPETGEDVPYYWRVRTIDSVHNESQWSETRLFYVQNEFSFPSWAIYTLIGIGAVLVGYLAYWMGRRTTFKPSE
jgi:hypothetical protein